MKQEFNTLTEKPKLPELPPGYFWRIEPYGSTFEYRMTLHRKILWFSHRVGYGCAFFDWENPGILGREYFQDKIDRDARLMMLGAGLTISNTPSKISGDYFTASNKTKDLR